MCVLSRFVHFILVVVLPSSVIYSLIFLFFDFRFRDQVGVVKMTSVLELTYLRSAHGARTSGRRGGGGRDGREEGRGEGYHQNVPGGGGVIVDNEAIKDISAAFFTAFLTEAFFSGGGVLV